MSTVIAGRVCKTLDKNSEAWTNVLGNSNAFDMYLNAGFLHKLNGYGVSGRTF